MLVTWVCDVSAQLPAATAPHPVAQQLFQGGAISCDAGTPQLNSVLAKGKKTSVRQGPKNNPDKSLITINLIQPESTGQNSLTLISLAPNQAVGCGASFQTLSYSDKACPKALEQTYPSAKHQPIAATGALLVTLTRTARVLATPAGTGCMVLKQEIVE